MTATAKPEDVGLCSKRLARIEEFLLTRYIDPKKIAGTLTVVERRGKVAYQSALGLRDIERNAPMTDDTIFRIYSMSKPITSVALMTLYEQGYFQLNDPVHKWIPEWKNLGVYVTGNHPQMMTQPCERPMTIHDLMTHMSGLTYGFMERTNVDRAYRRVGIGGAASEGTLREMIEKLAKLPLEFSPGTAWNYSVATDVLGYLVEVMSGKRFDDYLQDTIFGPLGMVDTGFHVPPDKADRFAANYSRNPDKTLRVEDDPKNSPYLRPATFLSGGGGLVSTAADYLRFARMLANDGELDGVRILGRKTLELMTVNHLPKGKDLTDLASGAFSETTYDGVGFGLGFSVQLGMHRSHVIGSYGEFAWGGAASTAFFVDQEEDLVVLFMTQLMPSNTFNFRAQLKSLVYSSLVD